jgi:Ras-related protein Rab-11A
VGALLVFDLTDRDSFDQLSYWLNCLREHADENLVVALVGMNISFFNNLHLANKYDLVRDNPSLRAVT